MNMQGIALGITDRSNIEPDPRGVRVAKYVDAYMAAHKGLSSSELAFRLRVDKRDLRRLLTDHSCGWRLEDSLAAYFGPDFVDAVFAPVVGNGRSRREEELARELATITARREAIQRDREDRRRAAASPETVLRMVPDRDRGADV